MSNSSVTYTNMHCRLSVVCLVSPTGIIMTWFLLSGLTLGSVLAYALSPLTELAEQNSTSVQVFDSCNSTSSWECSATFLHFCQICTSIATSWSCFNNIIMTVYFLTGSCSENLMTLSFLLQCINCYNIYWTKCLHANMRCSLITYSSQLRCVWFFVGSWTLFSWNTFDY